MEMMKTPPPFPAHSNLPSIVKAELPALYVGACTALSQCDKIDQCKDWTDKAKALASYAKQAQDDSLYKTALRIALRAHRRCGELLKEFQPATGGNGSNQHAKSNRSQPATIAPTATPTRTQAAANAGLSRDERIRAVKVAEIPAEEFEEAVESDDPPTPRELADRPAKPAPAIYTHSLDGIAPADFKQATALGGALQHFAREMADVNVAAALRGFKPHERDKTLEHARKVIALSTAVLEQMEEAWNQ
jgi:hypothetical protein